MRLRRCGRRRSGGGLAGHPGFHFSAQQLGLFHGDFVAGAVADISFDGAERLVEGSFGGGFVPREGVEHFMVLVLPLEWVFRHVPLDIFEALAVAQQKPVAIDELRDERFGSVIGGLVLVPPFLVESFVFGWILMAQDEFLRAAAVFGGVLRGDGFACGRARAGGGMRGRLFVFGFAINWGIFVRARFDFILRIAVVFQIAVILQRPVFFVAGDVRFGLFASHGKMLSWLSMAEEASG